MIPLNPSPRLPAAAALVAAMIAAPAVASAATYTGFFGDTYLYGEFTGVDQNGDARISQDELVSFSATLDNRNYGPGQYYVTSSSVYDFLFVDEGNGYASLSGRVPFWFEISTCGGWGQPPCGDEGGFAARSFMPYSATVSYTHLTLPTICSV